MNVTVWCVLAAVPPLGWAAVSHAPGSPVARAAAGVVVFFAVAVSPPFLSWRWRPMTIGALVWWAAMVMAWWPGRVVPAGLPWRVWSVASLVWWAPLLWHAAARAVAWTRVRLDRDDPDPEPDDETPEPPARARHAALALDDDGEDGPVAELFERAPSGPLREPVQVSLAYRPVAFEPPEDEPEATADGSLLDQLAAVWPERRRTEKGAVHVSDLADLVGWDEANLAAELEAEGLLVKDVTARPLNVRGAGATSKRGVRWASLRDRAVATGVATS